VKTAKVFRSGNSQAVRIPREFRLLATEVEISKRGNVILLRPRVGSWSALVSSLEKFSSDFMEGGRRQLPIQRRSSGRS